MDTSGVDRQEFGNLESDVKHLSGAVEKLTNKVEELTAVLNQARGAKYVIFIVPAIVGAIVSVGAFFGLKLTFGLPVP